MDVNLLQLLRVVHIVGATIWVGTAITLGYFVMPVLMTGNLAAGRLLGQIMVERKLAMVLPLVMFLVVFSGGYLYWLDFPHMGAGGFNHRALDYTLGALLGITAAIVGLTVNMPTGIKLHAVLGSVSGDSVTAEQQAEVGRLSRKLLIASRAIAILLVGAAALMSLARYAL